jgi:outer membrane protein OmpA-like peptidoglycan-associated protein
MIAHRMVLKRGTRDDAEKPFWISFADLMTALMVLFLVSLSVALVRAQAETAKAKQAQEEAARANQELKRREEELAKALAELKRREMERDTRREQRTAEVRAFLDEVEKIVRRHEGVVLDRERHVINFGPRAQFASDSHELSLHQANALRQLVPELMSSVRIKIDSGRNWVKRVVAEGFTDDTGTYLYNLNLSLQRSQRVLCVLLAREWPQQTFQRRVAADGSSSVATISSYGELVPIAEPDEQLIRSLFLVGGYSYNSQRPSRDESRRIELRIEFFQLDEPRTPPDPVLGDIGKCALGSRP